MQGGGEMKEEGSGGGGKVGGKRKATAGRARAGGVVAHMVQDSRTGRARSA